MEIIKRDSVVKGIIFGMIFSLLVVYLFITFSFTSGFNLEAFVDKLKTSNQFLTAVSSLVLIANVLLFGLFVQFKQYATARGLFIPTVIIGVAVLLYKFL
jgi:hypothetical protein